MIDWKAIPKIDAHIHLMPEDVIKANSGYDDPFVDYGSVNDYRNIMEEYNIEMAFIMPFNDPYMLSMDFTVQTVHSNLCDIVANNPSRLRCFADIDIRKSMSETLEELSKILIKEEFIGIKLHPTNTGYPIDAEYYDQIFKYASDNNVLLEIHSYPREHLMDDACSPSRIKKLLNKYPKARVSIAHMGGFQFEELYGTNAYINISAILPDIVSRFGVKKANEILRLIGVDRLVFATDYPDSRCLKPNEIYDKYFEILSEMDFTQEEAENICKNNALKMIGAM
ncbi:MAG: amidohydrolase family protein [Lachnospiraceae bacterium]|nr:amidohydrolase family protein [Lachnospiraceae bacterium]